MKIISIFLILFSVSAEIVTVKLPADLNEETITIFLINSDGTKKVDNFNVNKTSENILVNLDANQEENPLYTISAKKSSGDSYITPVQSLFQSKSEVNNYCVEKVNISLDSLANLKQIIQIREDRLKNKKDALVQILTPEVIEKLNKREISYGFSYDQPLSLELDIEELNLRLYKLETVTRNIRER